MAFGKKNEGLQQVTIKAPNFEAVKITIIGTAPYVTNNMSPTAEEAMKAGMSGQVDKAAKKKRPAKDFDAEFQGSMHIDTKDGWVGIPAAAIRAALIRACSTCGVEMTKAKQCFFVGADGQDEKGRPLVKITKGEPEKFECTVKNATGGPDMRARGRFDIGWEADLKLSFDADMFSASTVANLLLRAGLTVGVGAGRPFSSNRMSVISTPAQRWPIVRRKKAQTIACRNSMSMATTGVASHAARKLDDSA